jgi:predicted metal-dependent HD superfamily phosphohydrolase
MPCRCANTCSSSSELSLTRWHQRCSRNHQRASSIKIVTLRDWHTGHVSSVELELRVAWQRHLGTSDHAQRWFERLLGLYSAPSRHYHDARHVAWVVRHLSSIDNAHPLDDLDAVVAAAFFHDAVYDPHRSDNEEVSAAMAQGALAELDWPTERVEAVATMIMATAGHDAGQAGGDTRALLAADLGVLAAEPARYLDYCSAVRREYGHLDDHQWRQGRAAVLRSLLDSSTLFAPELGLDAWERRARANMTAELASLARPEGVSGA